MNQLRCKDLRAGDLMLKFNAGSLINQVIALGQQAAAQLNPQVVHAAVMFDSTYMVEASGGGIHASDLRVQNAAFGYVVYRPRNLAIANGAGTCAKMMFDIQGRHGNLKYSIPGAVGSLFPRGGAAPQSPDAMDQLLDRILEGRTHQFFCSQFVVFVYQFVAEQNGIGASSLFPLRDAKVSPSTLASLLQANPQFGEAGYMMPNER
jgi:hypothetical protein